MDKRFQDTVEKVSDYVRDEAHRTTIVVMAAAFAVVAGIVTIATKRGKAKR